MPVKVSRGIDECDYLLVLLSPISVESGWVQHEWSAKYWSEVESGEIRVIPVLLEDCAVPTLLRAKIYADVRSDYASGLEQIVDSLSS
ncbi:toll/interleukin-1 receptor domain-containing protein [Amycolatopsis sp. NPDC049159]|uniref:toll/interleukin-1 receptor domain-containing protein n=1 Tax=Amycolatopsis sp. NPDC049159 TaxID=3157210 RepID=UPI0033F03AB1